MVAYTNKDLRRDVEAFLIIIDMNKKHSSRNNGIQLVLDTASPNRLRNGVPHIVQLVVYRMHRNDTDNAGRQTDHFSKENP